MRKALILLTAAALTACSSSTLSEDDQAFCEEQGEEPVSFLRDEVEELIDDNHWSSDGEAFAFQTVTLDRSRGFLDSANIQDSELADKRDEVVDRLFDVTLEVDTSSETIATDPLRELQGALGELGSYCDDNG